MLTQIVLVQVIFSNIVLTSSAQVSTPLKHTLTREMYTRLLPNSV